MQIFKRKICRIYFINIPKSIIEVQQTVTTSLLYFRVVFKCIYRHLHHICTVQILLYSRCIATIYKCMLVKTHANYLFQCYKTNTISIFGHVMLILSFAVCCFGCRCLESETNIHVHYTIFLLKYQFRTYYYIILMYSKLKKVPVLLRIKKQQCHIYKNYTNHHLTLDVPFTSKN